MYVVGLGHTPFRRHPDRTHADLAAEAILQALADADQPDPTAIGRVVFGSAGLPTWGQPNLRGQVVLDGLLNDGTLAAGTPVINVEGGCATGSLALEAALRSGDDLALAVGCDKLFFPDDPARALSLFATGIDQLDPARWEAFHAEQAAAHGLRWAPHPQRVRFLDVHALHALHHLAQHGGTVDQIAAISARSHAHGALNPLAQHRKALTAEQILADAPIVPPLTRSMCAPLSDGAAAVLVASEAGLKRLSRAAQARAVRVRGIGVAGGRWRGLADPPVHALAAQRAWHRAGVTPDQVQAVELHDATSADEAAIAEALGLCAPGDGLRWAADDGRTHLGSVPVNTSGGLVSKGHPLAATGLSMVHELVTQLRGEAGPRQIQRALNLVAWHNAGGMIGLDEAIAVVGVLERT